MWICSYTIDREKFEPDVKCTFVYVQFHSEKQQVNIENYTQLAIAA
jgi:hypothetical protein